MQFRKLAGAAGLALLLAGTVSAYAAGIMDKPRPDYDAKGVPLGGFVLFPVLNVTGGYEDNIRQLPNPTGDEVFSETPGAHLVSNWDRHFAEVYGGVDNTNFLGHPELNITDWKAGTDGRLDISRSASFKANLDYGKYHEPLSSPNTVGFQSRPNRFDRGHVDWEGHYTFDRLTLESGGNLDRDVFSNTPLLNKTTLLDNSGRNEDIFVAYVKAAYTFSPGYSAFVRAAYDARFFDHFFDVSGYHRTTHGYRYDAGMDFALTDLLEGTVYVGYLDQLYNQHVPKILPDTSGLDYGAGLDWFATPLITVHLNAAHTISDTTLAGVSVSGDQNVRLSADYEFRRNMVVTVYGSYMNSRFVGSPRDDNDPGAGIAVKYLINRYTSATLSYAYTARFSTRADDGFQENLVNLGLNFHI